MSIKSDDERYLPQEQVVPPWPGRLVCLSRGQLYVRYAPPCGPDAARAEPAIMVHGLGGSAQNWTDLQATLRDRLEAQAPDLPGFGHSPAPIDGAYRLRDHAHAITALVEEQVGRPVHLFGNSLGGAVATIVAARRPDLVRTLTLVSPALPDLRPRVAPTWLATLAVPRLGEALLGRTFRRPVVARVDDLLALCFGDPSRVPAARRAEAVAELHHRAHQPHASDALLASLRGLVRAHLTFGRRSLWSLAAQVRAPTLLVYGGRDRLVSSRAATRAARAFRPRRMVMLAEAGHVAQMEYPEEVAAAFRRLAGQGG